MDFNSLITRLLDKFPYKENTHVCDWYNSDFLLTLTPIRKYLEKEINKLHPELDKSKIVKLIRQKVELSYYPEIKKVLTNLSELPELIQRSPEWHAFRKNLITGSESGSFLGISGFSNAINAFNGKIGLPCSKPNFNSPAIQHGTNYENVAKRVYELRNQVTVLELGCVVSPSPFIGASPDGIIFECHSDDWASWSKYGRMLEIKCPYSRIINDKIKPEYEIQILQQQYTCRLPICDFLEVGIIDSDHGKGVEGVVTYGDLDDLLKDQLDTSRPGWKENLKNQHIPWQNLTKDGLEKGIIIVAFYETGKNEAGFTDFKNETIIYPIEKLYVKEEINKWLFDKRRELEAEGASGYDVKLWKIYNYSVKTKVYHQKTYEDIYIPKLANVWNKITTLRQLPEEKQIEIIKSWSDILDLHGDNLFGKKNIINTAASNLNGNTANSINNIDNSKKRKSNSPKSNSSSNLIIKKTEINLNDVVIPVELHMEKKDDKKDEDLKITKPNIKARTILNSKKKITTSQAMDEILAGIDFTNRL